MVVLETRRARRAAGARRRGRGPRVDAVIPGRELSEEKAPVLEGEVQGLRLRGGVEGAAEDHRARLRRPRRPERDPGPGQALDRARIGTEEGGDLVDRALLDDGRFEVAQGEVGPAQHVRRLLEREAFPHDEQQQQYHLEALASQLAEAGDAPQVRFDAEIVDGLDVDDRNRQGFVDRGALDLGAGDDHFLDGVIRQFGGCIVVVGGLGQCGGCREY